MHTLKENQKEAGRKIQLTRMPLNDIDHTT